MKRITHPIAGFIESILLKLSALRGFCTKKAQYLFARLVALVNSGRRKL
jgi:hypothetical protein